MDENEIISQLREFFRTAELPEAPVQLNSYTSISDTKSFVEVSLRLIEGRLPAPRKMAIAELSQLKKLIESR
ncbi:DUF6965 family protein [Arsenicibacter rosenii]|uniref:Rho-GAP domain-containing protein n=1 Tax=Arsenicibacter rosenii TaxID=1750698 RepID=A0A1S2VNT9_9BACT|nr:hypothetical protein [Arsenicibacter rosenii]OIN59836.1 hypothetical protein BLX24_08230 [Arsenicibacter rosenii]